MSNKYRPTVDLESSSRRPAVLSTHIQPIYLPPKWRAKNMSSLHKEDPGPWPQYQIEKCETLKGFTRPHLNFVGYVLGVFSFGVP